MAMILMHSDVRRGGSIMMFELSQLRCFVAVARELNFRKAAAQLNMTQPPLSRQVKLLESNLGVLLLERSKHAVRLTVAGRAFYAEAVALLERARQAELVARKSARGDIGAVSIGFVASAVYDLIPMISSEIGANHPGIEISLRELTTWGQIEALNARQLDLAIVRATIDQPGIERELLSVEPFVLALPAGHRLGGRDEVTLADLHDQPMIMYSHSGWQPFHELLTGAFKARGIVPNIVQYINSSMSILALVRKGLGIALVPGSLQTLGLSGVDFRPIAAPDELTSELYLSWRSDNGNPIFPAVLTLVRNHRDRQWLTSDQG
jgi:DNA-binding transcriptional LysR family regulator